MDNNKYAIIVAGGRGHRMNSAIPKQFLDVAGKPVLMHTVEAFYSFSPEINLILVLPEDLIPQWKLLCEKHAFTIPIVVQKGGNSRFQSVKNGLDLINEEGLVAIHDGVRPLIDSQTIATSFKIAGAHGSAVASVCLKESLRLLEKKGTRSVDRSSFRLIQTPQTFKVSLVKQAYTVQEDGSMTDDASVVEKTGHNIILFDGSYANIKITTPEDLWMAEQLISYRAKKAPNK